VLDVNLTGVLLSMQQEIAHMRAHGGGVIVNTASNIGYHGRRPGMAAYAASKAAVSTLTRVAALDHIKDNVRINAVSPGATDTGMSLRPGETDADRAARLATTVPIARVATTDEIVHAVLWLASDESSFVVGHDLVVDGGVTS
jgi:NAD(P)-dependent dehydrogenase (short-subunit alcohol dehydrogenase family)